MPIAAFLAATALAAAPPTARASAAEIEAAHVAAEAATRSGDYRAAVRSYRAILDDLETRPATEADRDAWTRTLLRLAVAESTLGNGAAARSAMERAVAADPTVEVDPEIYSPAFRKELEAARARVGAMPQHRLRLSTRSGTGQGFVQGKPVGAVPVEVRLPPGTYRVGIEDGGTMKTVSVELSRDETVIVDTAPRLAAVPPPAASAGAPDSPMVESTSPADWMRPAAWGSASLGAVAAALAVWQGVAAAGSRAELGDMVLPDGSLKPGIPPSRYAATNEAWQSERRNAWIAGGSALLLGAGATVLFLLAPEAGVTPSAGGLALRF
jgi:hypothetical protein